MPKTVKRKITEYSHLFKVCKTFNYIYVKYILNKLSLTEKGIHKLMH